MMCYRDMTFCTEETCKLFGKDCIRSLTKEVSKAAEDWWGSPEAPIAQFGERPSCYMVEE